MEKEEFKNAVLKDGFISIDNGDLFYVVAQANSNNFKDMSEKLEQQLRREGKYNSYIGFISPNPKKPFTVQSLPIYGDPNKYVTKWFTDTPNKAIDNDVKSKYMGLLERASK